jgi:flagellar assembly protein FliH
MGKIIKKTQSERERMTSFERSSLEPYGPTAQEEWDDGSEMEEADAEAQASAILEEARTEAAAKIQQAYEEGLRRGMEAGRQNYLEQVQQSMNAVDCAAKELERLQGEAARRLQEEMVALTEAIVGRILRREARFDREAFRHVLVDILDHLSERTHMKIRLHPEDLQVLESEAQLEPDALQKVEQKEFVADEDVAQGGCIVETESAYVDATLDAQLANILESISDLNVSSPETE